MIRKTVLLSLTFVLVICGTVYAAGVNGLFKGKDIVRVTLDGNEITPGSVPGYLDNGNTMVPLGMLRKIGMTVDWNAKTLTANISRQPYTALEKSSQSLPTTTPNTNCVKTPTSKLVINVKSEGAKGDARTDDTAAIQAAVNKVAGKGGTVLVPAGTYMINTLRDREGGINLGSNMTFKMEPGAVLKTITNGADGYNLLNIQNQSNINILGGTLIGDRNTHTGTTGEYGMGVGIFGGTNIVVEGVTAQDFWGDGFYIGEGYWSTPTIPSTNISICSVIADNNRRQGISIVYADGVMVKDSIFKNTNGTWPKAGIDIEPTKGASVNDVNITNSQFLNNDGDGIEVYTDEGTGPVTEVIISGNTISDNGGGVELHGEKTKNIIVSFNTIKDAKIYGIKLWEGTSGNRVSFNDVTVYDDAAGNAIVNSDVGNVVRKNTIHEK